MSSAAARDLSFDSACRRASTLDDDSASHTGMLCVRRRAISAPSSRAGTAWGSWIRSVPPCPETRVESAAASGPSTGTTRPSASASERRRGSTRPVVTPAAVTWTARVMANTPLESVTIHSAQYAAGTIAATIA